ncbi:MAG TPA: DUF998 domain-containing protein [Candidatus Dormibacteraeota bacterium]|nr:DUF998 domain-containing protein [Candidatus Dormibacteraeota bacterium]
MSGLLASRRLALFGSIGPALFVAVVILVTALEWDFLHRIGWHLIQDSPIVYPSATAMGPYGWMQTLNFLQLGLSIIATAAALWMEVRPRPRVTVGLVFVAGIAVVLATFTTDGTSATPTTWHGYIHGLAFFLMLFSTLIGSLALATQLRDNPQWRPVALVSVPVPVVIVAVLVLSGAVKQAGGLLGIVSLLVIFGWHELLAVRLLTLTSAHRAT